MIVVICAVGAFTVNNAMIDLCFMVGFGIIGYVFKKLNYPLAPMVLALVLGDQAESSFRQAMLGSHGDMSIFWSNWLVGIITTLSMIMLFWPLISQWIIAAKRAANSHKAGALVGRPVIEGSAVPAHRER